MTPIQILTLARSHDITLGVQGDRLVVDAPTGTVSPELRQELFANKAGLVALLAPGTAFVTLDGGLTVPLQALLLALDLEQRGFRLSLGSDGAIRIKRTDKTGHVAAITASDRTAINRWRLHLGAIVGYRAPRVM